MQGDQEDPKKAEKRNAWLNLLQREERKPQLHFLVMKQDLINWVIGQSLLMGNVNIAGTVQMGFQKYNIANVKSVSASGKEKTLLRTSIGDRHKRN